MDRTEAFNRASALLNTLLEDYKFEPLSYGGSLMAPAVRVSPAEQRVNLIIQIADWLLESEEVSTEEYCDDETFVKVREVLLGAGLSSFQTDGVIDNMQNRGILFRERG